MAFRPNSYLAMRLYIIIPCCLFLSFCGPTAASQSLPGPEPSLTAEGDSLSLSPLADTYIRGGNVYKDSNYGNSIFMRVQNASSAKEKQFSFLQFDLSTITDPIAEAVLRLYPTRVEGEQTHALYFVVSDNWTESALTWQNRPARAEQIGASWTPVQDTDARIIVTQHARSAQSGDGALSLQIASEAPGSSIWTEYASREHPEEEIRPVLEITTEASDPGSTVSVEPLHTEHPDQFILKGNYPNPFNPATTIAFSLQAPAFVTIGVYDLMGRMMIAVPPRQFTAGPRHEVSIDASNLPSGTYLYKVNAHFATHSESKARRMVLSK